MLMVAVVVFVLSPGTGHQRCDMLLRTFVSRNAAGKGRAILEGVGLPGEMRNMCYTNNPLNEEEAIQAGLMKWKDGEGSSATWMVLLGAMTYAGIAVQHITRLKEELLQGTNFQPITLTVASYVLLMCCVQAATGQGTYCVVAHALLPLQCTHCPGWSSEEMISAFHRPVYDLSHHNS